MNFRHKFTINSCFFLDKCKEIRYFIYYRTEEAFNAHAQPQRVSLFRRVHEEVLQMYAIIATGGKQYRVQEGDVIHVEKLNLEPEEGVEFPVLLLGGESVTVGKPYVKGAKVTGKVLAQVKGEKIIVFKYKSKKNYRRKAGHRQPYTRVEIVSIQA